MSLTKGELYEFAKFRLDVSERLLTGPSGKRLPLSERAFDTLRVLVANAGRLVSKSEMMNAVWQDSFVEENNLDKCIHSIRRALKEKPGEQKFIETVRRHGYRFVAKVDRIESGSNFRVDPKVGIERNGTVSNGNVISTDDRPQAPDTGGHQDQHPFEASLGNTPTSLRFPSLTKFRIAFLTVLSLILFAGFYVMWNSAPSTPERGRLKIAVLPLKPIDSRYRSEDYEIGIADSLINKINALNGLFARPLSSIRKYTDLEQDPLAAGKEQQVDFVLSANYQIAENRIRVTWHLINIATGQIEDSQTSESSAIDQFGKQDAVVADIGNRLAKRFTTTYVTAATKRGTDNEEAYRLYLQAMYLYDRRTSSDARRAVEKLDRAIALDPNYAQAWAGKAHAHRSLGNFGGSASPHEEYRHSMAAVTHALSLDENLSDAYSALCENKFFYEYDYTGAERECKRAIELSPNSYLAHEIYSRCLWTLSRFDEAIAEAKLSIDIQPTSLFSQRNLAIGLYYARRYDEAVHEFKRVSDMDPNFVANYAWFIPAMLVQGRDSEAFEWFIRWQALMKLDEKALNAYRTAFEMDNWQGVGRVRVKQFNEDKIRSYFLEACLIAHTGDRDKTFEYLEKSFERREWGIPFLRIDPSLDTIRSDPRFDDLVTRVESGGKL